MRTEYKNWIMLFVLLCVVVAGLFGISGKLAGDRQKEGERREVWAVSKEKCGIRRHKGNIEAICRGTERESYGISLGDSRRSESAVPVVSESQ